MQRRIAIWCIVVVLTGVSVFALSWQAPYCSDDFCIMPWMFGGSMPTTGRFPSFSDFASIPEFWQTYWHNCKTLYLEWGGRFLAWLFTFPLLSLPRCVFAAVNAILWMTLSYCVWVLCGRPSRGFVLVFSAFVVVGIDPEAVLWMSGSFSYLFAISFAALGAVLCLRYGDSGKSSNVLSGRCLFLFVLGFLSVGGHELVAMTMSACLCVWFLVRWRDGFRVASWGRGYISLTLGCLLGGLACIFAPGNLVRAGQRSLGFDQSLSLWMRIKLIQFAHVCMDRPIVALFLLVLVLLLVLPGLRKRLGRADWLWMFAATLNLALTMFFTDGAARASWFAGCLALVAVLRVMFLLRLPDGLQIGLEVVSFAIASLVVWQTFSTARVANGLYARLIDEWISSPGIVTHGEYLNVCHKSHFDRSLIGVVGWGTGEEYVNAALCRFYGKRRMIVVDDWTRMNVLESDRAVTNPSWRLTNLPGWFASPNADILVGVCTNSDVCAGQAVEARVCYRVPERVPRSLRDKAGEYADMILRRNVCEWTKCLPRQEIESVVRLPGYVLDTPRGRFFVVRHNRNVDRNLIEALEVTPLKPN